MPVVYSNVYLQSAGMFLPGTPVDNAGMDAYVAPLNRISDRLKRRILGENGIQTRHYAIDGAGQTVFSNAQMAQAAIEATLAQAGRKLGEVGFLSSGSSGGDALMPGFANMIQGEMAAPPMETLSVHGVCAASVGALQAAAQAVEGGAHPLALAVASEMPSRLFKRSRFAAQGYDTDFDAHFLRWMLSDGAGAVLLGGPQALPHTPGLRLKLRWTHQRSFAGDYPVCMQLGLTPDRSTSHLDFPAWGDAEAAGALALRQDIRLLPHLFDVCIHEYADLAHQGWVPERGIDHFLCHYSSERFIPVVDELLEKAQLGIPRERWWSNLAWRGNTGAASIFIMLSEFLQQQGTRLKAGDTVLCFIPESGRFTAGFMLWEVEADTPVQAAPQASLPRKAAAAGAADSADQGALPDVATIAAPHDPATAPQALAPLLTELASIWQDYRSRVWRTPLLQRMRTRQLDTADYVRWMGHWIPQVREGSLWMREGAASLTGEYAALAGLIDLHADDEQHDFKVLHSDYLKAGGTATDIGQLRRNPGGEALNAYLHGLAATPNPIGLLGAIYIIEGTGQRIVPSLLPLLRQALPLPPDAFRFLEYHGANDEHHLERWLMAVQMALALDADGTAAQAIVQTAQHTAQLYLMQFQHVLPQAR
ncbi:iron-containing redox enzyme family protein [Comamonas terrigena]|uniref:iron-containing redox enzyme family protein n=1 Tax=Comamonas terrigena TaxID=32013 RepID=UPI00244CD1CB|nr:iron-containing redox enzyme family protein [Comamonas terrigena]MDH0050107.1 iron-containing redox enzyme family protein [Comamonas terrigena]MDH0512329.1 iron-containing redox enzyme family protein [Comamonas terrigena]MDH1091855.1 iron-containing redox enzyme family protein [Comamonas terrigena]MDH1502075.1 iron-containing redox enzyme family protein [Comamonas terrigena]